MSERSPPSLAIYIPSSSSSHRFGEQVISSTGKLSLDLRNEPRLCGMQRLLTTSHGAQQHQGAPKGFWRLFGSAELPGRLRSEGLQPALLTAAGATPLSGANQLSERSRRLRRNASAEHVGRTVAGAGDFN